MSGYYLDFEKSIVTLEQKIKELEAINDSNVSLAKDIESLRNKKMSYLVKIYKNLSPWQKVLVARHPERPHFVDYIKHMVTDFVELKGDRYFADDEAIIGGLGRIDGRSVVIIGTEKGNSIEGRLKHNFGMARPEGYRKAQRLMKLASKFNLPIVTLIDTAGAYPGIEAEERGQSEAIAKSIETCFEVEVPLISVIVGEGGSGGAIALAAGDKVLMLEHSIYSVISPEGCASILWRDGKMAETAAEALKFTALDLKKFGIIDEIIQEPVGGAHRDHVLTIGNVQTAILNAIKEVEASGDVVQNRHKKFMKMTQDL